MAEGFQFIQQSRVQAPGAQALPQLSDGSATAQGAMRLGQAVTRLSAQLKQINDTTQVTQSDMGLRARLNEIDERAQKDTDYGTMPDRYKEEIAQAYQESASQISDPSQRLQFESHAQKLTIMQERRIRERALTGQQDVFAANLKSIQADTFNKAVGAQSPDEALAIQNSYFADLDANVAKGMLTAEGAQQQKQTFLRSAGQTRLMSLGDKDPDAALKALNDPSVTQAFQPQELEAYRQQFITKKTDLQYQQAVNATRFGKPAQAIAITGRITDLRQVDFILDGGLIAQESGGNPNAVNASSGAIGLTQLMPDTARMVSKRIGLNDVAGMSNEALTQYLTANPSVNRAISAAYLKEGAKKFNGRLVTILAGYHGGYGDSGRPAKAYYEAVAKYGESFSDEQYLSLLGNLTDGTKRTADYVRDIITRMGGKVSDQPHGVANYKMATAVGSELDSQVKAEQQRTRAMAALNTDSHDDIMKNFKSGYAVDPVALNQQQLMLMQKVASGDTGAATQLRELQHVQQIAPIVAQAHKMAPAELEAAYTLEDRRLRSAPSVSAYERKRVDALESVMKVRAQERDSDPVGLYARYQGAQYAPLPVGAAFNSPEFLKGFADRGTLALQAASTFSGKIVPIRPEELAPLKERWDGAGTNDRWNFINALLNSGADQKVVNAAVTQVAGENVHVKAATEFGRNDPALGRTILEGAALLNQQGVKPKADDMLTALKNQMGGNIFPANVMDNVANAAMAVYVAERGKSASLFDASDAGGFEKALTRVMGPTFTRNGQKVPVASGTSESQMRYVLDDLRPEDVPGGKIMDASGNVFNPYWVGRNANLRLIDDVKGHRYAVTLNQGNKDLPLLDANGQVLVIDMRDAVNKRLDQGYSLVSVPFGPSIGNTFRDIVNMRLQRSDMSQSEFQNSVGASLGTMGGLVP